MSEITLSGDFIIIGGIRFKRKPRWYTVTIIRDATVNKQFTGQIQIDPGNAPFILTSYHAGDTADGNAITSQEAWLVQASDNESAYQWTDGLAERSSVFGSREFGYNLPEPSPIRANTRITWTVQNKAAAPTAGNAIIVLRGWSLTLG